MSSKSVPEASSKSVPEEGQVESVLQECQIRVSSKKCPRRVSSKSVLQECQVRLSYKSAKQEVSSKSVLQECQVRVSSKKGVLQECHLSVSRQGVPQAVSLENVINKYPLCSSTYASAFGFVGFILFFLRTTNLILLKLKVPSKQWPTSKRRHELTAVAGAYTDGLVHVSKMDHGRVDNPEAREDGSSCRWICFFSKKSCRFLFNFFFGSLLTYMKFIEIGY